MSDRLLKRICEHEGFRQFPYFDCCGKPFRQCKCVPQGVLTLGHGRNAESVGIRYEESLELVRNDIQVATNAARKMIREFDALDEVRREVVIEMIYNLGPLKFMGFRKMLAAVARRDFSEAAKEMLSSLWAKQVKGRALTLARMMETGELPE